MIGSMFLAFSKSRTSFLIYGGLLAGFAVAISSEINVRLLTKPRQKHVRCSHSTDVDIMDANTIKVPPAFSWNVVSSPRKSSPKQAVKTGSNERITLASAAQTIA